MRIVRLDHVNLGMPPGEEASARWFWVEVFGFEELPKPEELAGRGGCWFASGDICIHVSARAEFTPATQAHLAFRTAQLDDAASILAAEKLPVRFDRSVAGVRRLFTTDPFGNRIELIQSGDIWPLA